MTILSIKQDGKNYVYRIKLNSTTVTNLTFDKNVTRQEIKERINKIGV
jgi:hypothetical protein